MPKELWNVYARGQERIIRKSSERSPLGYKCVGYASQSQIDEELKRRQELVSRRERNEEFSKREDYQIAQSVIHILDSMSFEDHPLDRLTINEWRELLKTLRG